MRSAKKTISLSIPKNSPIYLLLTIFVGFIIVSILLFSNQNIALKSQDAGLGTSGQIDEPGEVTDDANLVAKCKAKALSNKTERDYVIRESLEDNLANLRASTEYKELLMIANQPTPTPYPTPDFDSRESAYKSFLFGAIHTSEENGENMGFDSAVSALAKIADIEQAFHAEASGQLDKSEEDYQRDLDSCDFRYAN